MAPPWGPGARALRIYCCAGASFPDLLLVVCRGRVLASHWMTVELLHIRIVARDGRPRGSSFTGGVAFRRGPPFRYLPLCCSSLLRTRPTFSNGSPLLRRSALRRSPSFWSRSFFPSGSCHAALSRGTLGKLSSNFGHHFRRRDMSGIRDFLVAFALALGATLTVAWDGLLGYGLFRLVSAAF